jgi:ABC-type lipoprotein release transport system permease subunit
MGKTLLVWRLVVKDIRHHAAEALLLLMAIAAAAATLTLGLSLHGATNSPYEQTRAATKGPDVVDTEFPPNNGPANPTVLQPLEHAGGVIASSGPFPVTWATLRTNGTATAAEAEGRNAGRSLVDQPKLTEGTWVRPGGVVVECGFATGLGVRLGDRITLAGHSFEVVGIAVTASFPSYTRLCVTGCDEPNNVSGDPGLVWLTEADENRVSRWASAPVAYYLNLKLRNPATAGAFANAHNYVSPTAPVLFSWQEIRDADSKIVENAQLVLLTGSWLLGLLAIASVAVLVGGRMAEDSRRVGLLKAVGGTPGFVATVLLAENLLLALCAVAVGLFIGRLAAPLVDGPGTSLLGAANVPIVTAVTVGVVVAVAVAVAVLATLVPAVRAARTSTVSLLLDAARAPRRRAWMIAPSRHLPVALLISARLAARRPRRLLLNIFGVAVTASGIVTVLIVHSAAIDTNNTNLIAPGNPIDARLNQVTLVLSVMLVILASINAVFIAWATVLDSRRSSALMRALGATRREATAGLVMVQMLPALIGAILGIPGGIAIYAGAKSGDDATSLPPVLWLVAMVLGTMLVLGALTTIPARIGGRRSLAETLQSEAA